MFDVRRVVGEYIANHIVHFHVRVVEQRATCGRRKRTDDEEHKRDEDQQRRTQQDCPVRNLVHGACHAHTEWVVHCKHVVAIQISCSTRHTCHTVAVGDVSLRARVYTACAQCAHQTHDQWQCDEHGKQAPIHGPHRCRAVAAAHRRQDP